MLHSYISGAEEDNNLASRISEELFKQIHSFKAVRVVFYPSLENYIASAILLKTLSLSDIDVIIQPSLKNEGKIEEPVIILGFNNRTSIIAPYILQIEKNRRIHENLGKGRRIGIFSSYPAFIARMLENNIVITDETLLLSILVSVGSGNIKGIDYEYINKLLEKKIIEQYDAALKIYEWHKKPLCDAISLTIEPFIPGISGRKDNCISALTGEGIKIIDNKGNHRKILDLSEDELKRMVNLIYNMISSKSKIKIEINEIVSKTYVILKEDFIGATDMRFLYQIILYTSETEGPEYVIASSLNKLYMAYINGLYEDNVPRYAHEINRIIKSKPQETEKAVIVNTNIILPPSLVSSILRIYHNITSKPVIVCTETKCILSLENLMKKNRNIKDVEEKLRGLVIEAEDHSSLEEIIY